MIYRAPPFEWVFCTEQISHGTGGRDPPPTGVCFFIGPFRWKAPIAARAIVCDPGSVTWGRPYSRARFGSHNQARLRA